MTVHAHQLEHASYRFISILLGHFANDDSNRESCDGGAGCAKSEAVWHGPLGNPPSSTERQTS